MPWGIAAAVAGAVVSSALAPDPPSGGGGGGGGAAAKAADPFAEQRPQYQTQLNTLMNGGFSPSDPSYGFRFNQGMDSLNRTKAAEGLTQSGNQSAALVDYGQNQASTEYSNQFNRLAQLSGANVGSPAAAGQILYGQNQANQQSASAVGGIVSKGVNAFADWVNQPAASGTQATDMAGFQTQQPSYFSGGDAGGSNWSSGYDFSGFATSQ